ncbi:hypothetical protein ACI48D_03265 [Massilia sp. LXY-6]|uniref:hypothetical protein n=1 Tax=Massilia sp. LXY-6 TaxID=3379823 RepID=UPI003EDE7B4F
MRHTLKAVFAHRSDAQHVLDELLACGYSRADTALSDAEGLGASVRHNLARLFTSLQHKHAMANAAAFMQGRHVVTVTADSEPDAERAIGIIQRFRPVGIEDVPGEWEQSTAGMSMRNAWTDAVGPGSVYPPGTGPGALQYRAHEDSHYFGTQNAGAPPTGNTFEEPMETFSPWPRVDEEPPFGHMPFPLADADRDSGGDMAAYGFGKAMRTSDKYRNRSWDEVEPDLESGWKMREPGAPDWDEARAAVRRGWDSTSPDIDEDSYYRTHWNARYANGSGGSDYGEHAPAYLYGSEARRSEIYRSHDWGEVEPDLKAGWEARHPGQLSSWENFKDAVKHGWNRVSPG